MTVTSATAISANDRSDAQSTIREFDGDARWDTSGESIGFSAPVAADSASMLTDEQRCAIWRQRAGTVEPGSVSDFR